MLEIVYSENSEQFYLMQKIDSIIVKFKTWKNIQILCLNLENTISLGVLWENSEQFFKY